MDYLSDFDGAYVKTRLGKVYCKKHFEGNDKKSILLLHGFGGTTKNWTRLVSNMPEGFNVYMLDLLGHGMSEAPEIEYRIDQQEAAVAEAVSSLGIKNVYLCGHSYGGWVAALYAIRKRRMGGLMLIDAAGLESYFKEVDMNTRIGQKKRKEILDKVSVFNAGRMEVMERIAESNMLEEHITAEELKNINSPTLIIWGENDDIIDRRFAEEFRDGIQGSRLFIIKGAKHNPHYTHPKEVAGLLLKFILAGQ